MRINTRRIALLVGSIFLLGTIACAQDVLIVVNRTVTVPQLTENQLRDIFIGARSQFDDGARAIPVLLKGGPTHEVFLHRHIGDSPDEFRIRWRRAVFTGQGAMPKEFTTESALLDYVETTPGAIGYISRMQSERAVKVLTIANPR